MTYLEAINSVLRRLREDQANTALESSYSALIGDLVNDAKRIVEQSWNWSSLRNDIVFNTVSGTSEYSLTCAQMNAVIKSAINMGSQYIMQYQSKQYFDNLYYNQTPAEGLPTDFKLLENT